MADDPHTRPAELVVWRDSVAAGDDAAAPNAVAVPLAGTDGVTEVARRLGRPGGLPHVSGGRATWVLEGTKPLAVLAQQWATPRVLPPFLEHRAGPFWLVGGDPHLWLRYRGQADPAGVFAGLSDAAAGSGG